MLLTEEFRVSVTLITMHVFSMNGTLWMLYKNWKSWIQMTSLAKESDI